ncbi:uncharacterized protein LOC105197815 isoform X3 [Solenopsis invicta]|uniref:uncharacterized protein LOC105197815 isoform X3 n=1 Tax=Solenopsis invicta TaxID=13686 RepID=UPI000595EE04|nr:uncharacterized protein LOC105197815 isoform X3 [Solenopsis invicta]
MKDEGRRTKDEGRNQAGTFVGRSLVLSAKVKKQRRNKKIRIEKKAQGFTRKQRSSHVINVISPTLLQLPVHRIVAIASTAVVAVGYLRSLIADPTTATSGKVWVVK